MSQLDSLLERTSRTFALTIPLLPDPTRETVGTAYLLFRIADTFEDSTTWPHDRRIDALGEFRALLDAPSPAAATRLSQAWLRLPPHGDAGYTDLLAQSPVVIEHYVRLDPATREIVRLHVQRTCIGMADYLRRTGREDASSVADIADLRQYCYVVAGIVGEMLTELFLLDNPGLTAAAPELRAAACRFGESLQLTNILKDALADQSEGRQYLPSTVSRAEVFQLARSSLKAATGYISTLKRMDAPRGLIHFTALPVLLASATLDRVERDGPGSKLTRPEVAAILGRLDES